MDFCPNMRYTAKYVFQVRFVFLVIFRYCGAGWFLVIFILWYSTCQMTCSDQSLYCHYDVMMRGPLASQFWCVIFSKITCIVCIGNFFDKNKKVIIYRLFAQLFSESHEGGKNVIVFFDTYPQQRGEEVSKKIFIPLFPSIWAHNHYHASIPHVNQRGHQTWHVKVI